MMNPDQMYTLQQLRHDDLRAEAEQVRAVRELANNRTVWGSVWLVTWLLRLSACRTGSAIPTARAR
jgi:hypothetical protein